MWKDQSGLTLAEILVAIMLLMLPLVAVMSGFPLGLQAMEIGRQKSTAVFLTEQKVDRVKAWAVSTAAGQGFGSITNGTPSGAPCCAPEGYGSIPGYSGYRRQVNVSDGPTTTTKVVQVQVFYRPVLSTGLAATETEVRLTTQVGSP